MVGCAVLESEGRTRNVAPAKFPGRKQGRSDHVKKAAIFDLDGTLVDANELHVQAWQETLQHFGKEIPVEKLREQIAKGGDPENELRDAGAIAIFRDPADLLAHYYQSPLAG